MTIQEIKSTAFGKWLMQQDRQEAVLHLWECLTHGKPDNLAWDLVELTNGTKDFPAKEIEAVINKAYEELVLA